MNKRNRTIPTIRFSFFNHRIHISKAVLYAIGSPAYIQIIITPDNKTLYVKKCLDRVFDRFAVPRRVYTDGIFVFGLQKTAFAEAVLIKMGWDKNGIYRIYGESITEDVMAFKLDEAERIDKENK